MIREKNIKTIYSLIEFLEQRKIKEYSKLFAQNGKQVNPYHSGLFPKEIVGQMEIYKFTKRNISENFSKIRFQIEEVMPFKDPNKIAVKFYGKFKLKQSSGFYENDYLGLFYFDDDGKILEFIEYWNPIIAAKAFGLMDKLK